MTDKQREQHHETILFLEEQAKALFDGVKRQEQSWLIEQARADERKRTMEQMLAQAEALVASALELKAIQLGQIVFPPAHGKES